MLDPGTVVMVPFAGVKDTKVRPAVVISTLVHQTHQNDVVVGALTGQLHQAKGPTDYILQDWVAAGLHLSTAFRLFLNTLPLSKVIAVLGKLTDRDWKEVQARLRLGLAVT